MRAQGLGHLSGRGPPLEEREGLVEELFETLVFRRIPYDAEAGLGVGQIGAVVGQLVLQGHGEKEDFLYRDV